MDGSYSNNNDDDIDLSVISPHNPKSKDLNFSINDLLDNPQPKQNSPQFRQGVFGQILKEGSFMKDLQKMQKQLSYQTIPYDIYEQSEGQNQFTGTLEAKYEETCTKTINNMTKLLQRNSEFQFRHLILDFTEQRLKEKKTDSFDDYFQKELLTPKKKLEKNRQKQKSIKSKQNSAKSIFYQYPDISNKKIVPFKEKERSVLRSKDSSKRSQKSVKSVSKVESRQRSTKGSTVGSKNSYNLFTKGYQNNNKKTVVSKEKTFRQKKMVGLEQEAFAEYFGFEVQKSAKNGSTTNQIKSKNGGGSKSSKKKSGGETSKSKGKKIVFSKKIVNLYH